MSEKADLGFRRKVWLVKLSLCLYFCGLLSVGVLELEEKSCVVTRAGFVINRV